MSTAETTPRTVFVERLLVSRQVLRETAIGRFTGGGKVSSIVQREDGYEVTFTNPSIAEHFIEEGLQVAGRFYEVVDALAKDTQVTMQAVPYYIQDEDLLKELEKVGFKVISEICRIEEYLVETGDRKVTVKGSDPSGDLPKSIVIMAPNGRSDVIRLWWRSQKINMEDAKKM